MKPEPKTAARQAAEALAGGRREFRPFRLRTPHLFGLEPGVAGTSTASQLREMKNVLAAAVRNGRVKRAEARREERVLDAAMSFALRNGRAPIAFDAAEVVDDHAERTRKKKRRRTVRDARRKNRPPKRRKRR